MTNLSFFLVECCLAYVLSCLSRKVEPYEKFLWFPSNRRRNFLSSSIVGSWVASVKNMNVHFSIRNSSISNQGWNAENNKQLQGLMKWINPRGISLTKKCTRFLWFQISQWFFCDFGDLSVIFMIVCDFSVIFQKVNEWYAPRINQLSTKQICCKCLALVWSHHVSLLKKIYFSAYLVFQRLCFMYAINKVWATVRYLYWTSWDWDLVMKI